MTNASDPPTPIRDSPPQIPEQTADEEELRHLRARNVKIGLQQVLEGYFAQDLRLGKRGRKDPQGNEDDNQEETFTLYASLRRLGFGLIHH